MGQITTITLMVGEVEEENVALFLGVMVECGFVGSLKDVSDAAVSGSVPSPILIGAFKQGNRPALANMFVKIPWRLPGHVLLIVQTEDGPFHVITPQRHEFMVGGQHPEDMLFEIG